MDNWIGIFIKKLHLLRTGALYNSIMPVILFVRRWHYFTVSPMKASRVLFKVDCYSYEWNKQSSWKWCSLPYLANESFCVPVLVLVDGFWLFIRDNKYPGSFILKLSYQKIRSALFGSGSYVKRLKFVSMYCDLGVSRRIMLLECCWDRGGSGHEYERLQRRQHIRILDENQYMNDLNKCTTFFEAEINTYLLYLSCSFPCYVSRINVMVK